MIRLFADAQFDFLSRRRPAYVLAAAFLAVGAAFLTTRGLNESIEFTGGTLVQVRADSGIRTADIRTALDRAGVVGTEITTFGAPHEFKVTARLDPRRPTADEGIERTAAVVDSALAAAFGPERYEIERTEAVGPKVGGELREKALLAIVMSFGATLVYLWFRFEWRFGVAAVLATAHDILTTVAFISLMDLEITLVVVAALLTIVGYSLNDTIITFDRVRENFKKFRRANIYDVLNRSINETLPRTVLTSGTTLVATVALLVLGGGVIRGFAWVMTFGIITGTFSSIFIAAPILLAIERRWPGEDTRGARTLAAATAG